MPPHSPGDGLRHLVDNGALWLEPDAASSAAAICDEWIRALRDERDRVRELDQHLPLGDCVAGRALSRHLQLTARGRDDARSLYDVLDAYLEMLRDLRQTYLAAARQYRAADDDAAATFRRLEDGTS